MMQAIFFSFLMKSALCSGFLLGYYWLFLRNKQMHQFNRFYLLLTVAISLVLPLMHFEWPVMPVNAAIPVLRLLEVTPGGGSESTSLDAAVNVTSDFSWITIGYWVVVLLLLILLLVRVTSVYRLKKRFNVTEMNGFDLVQTTLEKAPFSFLNNLFWRVDIDMEDLSGQQILKHEMVHIRQRHTLDKLFLQVTSAICWVNPCYWIIHKELSCIHEFIADELAIQDKDTEAFALMLLQTHYGQEFRDVIHPFFHSPIKRRLTMLHPLKLKYPAIRKFMAMPLLAISVLLFSFEKKETGASKAAQKIILALDAGHGGEDRGATGVDGTLEKDLNLLVVRKLSALAREYNIDPVLVRNDDHSVPLQHRADIANKARATLFLSIHINSSSPDANTSITAPYEVIVDEQNANYDKSKLLASAIAGRISSAQIQPKLSERHLMVLRNTTMPAMLIECGDIKNAAHVGMLNDEKQLEAFCRNILSGIVDYSKVH